MSGPRGSRSSQPASNRTNEYFVPKEGIDREVITADICRYLGNDALVRPGNYENPSTGAVQAGYFITAYRNLTTEMIADLKADSARWEAERRQTASRGQPSGVEYRSSTTHQSRQYYGPTENTSSTGFGTPQPQVQSQPNAYGEHYGQPSIGGYSQAYPRGEDGHYFIQGGDLRPTSSEVRTQPAIPSQPGTAYAQPQRFVQPAQNYADSRATPYYTQAGPGNVTPQQQYSAQQQPSDPFYGRAVTAGSYDPPSVPYDGGGYTQATMQSGTPAVVPARREREREPERDNRRHRHR